MLEKLLGLALLVLFWSIVDGFLTYLKLLPYRIERERLREQVMFYSEGFAHTFAMEAGEAKALYLEVCDDILATSDTGSEEYLELLERRDNVRSLAPGVAFEWLIGRIMERSMEVAAELAELELTIQQIQQPS